MKDYEYAFPRSLILTSILAGAGSGVVYLAITSLGLVGVRSELQFYSGWLLAAVAGAISGAISAFVSVGFRRAFKSVGGRFIRISVSSLGAFLGAGGSFIAIWLILHLIPPAPLWLIGLVVGLLAAVGTGAFCIVAERRIVTGNPPSA